MHSHANRQEMLFRYVFSAFRRPIGDLLGRINGTLKAD